MARCECGWEGHLAADRQEGLRHRLSELRRSAGGGALPRLDRRAEARTRRAVLPAALHPAPSTQFVVEDQYRPRGAVDRCRLDAAWRPARSGSREGGRALGRRVSRFLRHGSARRTRRSAHGEQEGQGILRSAGQDQPLFVLLARAYREKAGDTPCARGSSWRCWPGARRSTDPCIPLPANRERDE